MTQNAGAMLEDVGPADKVLALLREQAAMYGKLETLAVRQQTLVAVEDAGPLLSLLADRQKLADGLTQVASRLEPVRQEWVAYRKRLSPSEQVEADQLWKDARQLLRRIIERDEQDARVLSARKQSGRRGLQTTHVTREALSAYRAPAAGAARLNRLDEVD